MNAQDPGIDPETFRRLADYVALPLADTRMEEVRLRVETYLRRVHRLRTLDLQDVEPSLTVAPLSEGRHERA